MRMTAKQLRKIIREEVARVRLSEARPGGRRVKMDKLFAAIEQLPDADRREFYQRLNKGKFPLDLNKLEKDVSSAQAAVASRGPLPVEDVGTATVCVYSWRANEPIVPKLIAMAEDSGLEVDARKDGSWLEIWLSGPADDSTSEAMANVAYTWNKYAIKKKLNGEDNGDAWGYPSDPGVGPWGSDDLAEVGWSISTETEYT